MALKCECGKCELCKSRRGMQLRREQYPDDVRAVDRARYYRDRPKRLAASRLYHESHRERVNGYKKAWADRNPEKRKAQNAVSNAFRDGRLAKGPCERRAGGGCSKRIEAHHDDYTKPLVVRWLCSRHHAELRRLESDGTA